jgi:mpaB/rubber oxygenase-like protein
MLGLAFLLAIDAAVAFSLFADAAMRYASHLLHPVEPFPLPPHTDPRTITRYTDATLGPLRDLGDPPTDQLVQDIAESGDEASEESGEQDPPPSPVHAFYKVLLAKRKLDLADFDGRPYAEELGDWAAGIAPAPVAFGPRLERAGNFFKKNLVKIVIVYGTSGLLEAFACARGVQVLGSTQYLSNEPGRRLFESLQFLLYVNEPNAFKAGGNAHMAILRVRLLHACIRWILENEPEVDWQRSWGRPINGEDLLGMQMGFSGMVIRDLAKLWVKISEEEANDHLFLWNVVGQILGVPMQLRADSLGEALALIAAIERRQLGASVKGRLLADALVAFHREHLRMLFPVGLYLMRRVAGEDICRMLDVPWSPIASARFLDTVIDKTITIWGGGIVFGRRGWQERPELDVPPSLDVVFDQIYAEAQLDA